MGRKQKVALDEFWRRKEEPESVDALWEGEEKILIFRGGNLEEETCVGGNLSKQIMTEHGSFASTFLTVAVPHDGFTWKMA